MVSIFLFAALLNVHIDLDRPVFRADEAVTGVAEFEVVETIRPGDPARFLRLRLSPLPEFAEITYGRLPERCFPGVRYRVAFRIAAKEGVARLAERLGQRLVVLPPTEHGYHVGVPSKSRRNAEAFWRPDVEAKPLGRLDVEAVPSGHFDVAPAGPGAITVTALAALAFDDRLPRNTDAQLRRLLFELAVRSGREIENERFEPATSLIALRPHGRGVGDGMHDDLRPFYVRAHPGDSIEILNPSTTYLCNVNGHGQSRFNQAIQPGTATTVRLTRKGLVRVHCDVHGATLGWIMVEAHEEPPSQK